MVWEGVNKACVERERGGSNGGTDTLNSIQYLICNAVLTSAESQVQCYISCSISTHDIVHQYWGFHKVIA